MFKSLNSTFSFPSLTCHRRCRKTCWTQLLHSLGWTSLCLVSMTFPCVTDFGCNRWVSLFVSGCLGFTSFSAFFHVIKFNVKWQIQLDSNVRYLFCQTGHARWLKTRCCACLWLWCASGSTTLTVAKISLRGWRTFWRRKTTSSLTQRKRLNPVLPNARLVTRSQGPARRSSSWTQPWIRSSWYLLATSKILWFRKSNSGKIGQPSICVKVTIRTWWTPATKLGATQILASLCLGLALGRSWRRKGVIVHCNLFWPIRTTWFSWTMCASRSRRFWRRWGRRSQTAKSATTALKRPAPLRRSHWQALTRFFRWQSRWNRLGQA